MDKQEKLIARLFKDTFIVFVVSTLAATLGNLIDGILISKFLGTEAIAAFGLTVPYQRFTAMLPAIIALGMQILCSKSLGKGDLREANQIFSLATTLTFGLAVLMTAGTFLFTQPILDILGADKGLGNIASLTADYLRAYSLSLPAMALGVVFMPLMQLDCDRQRTVIAITSLSVCNVICDAISIFVLNGGMWGIGIATLVSYLLGMTILSLHFFKPDANFAYAPKVLEIISKAFGSSTQMISGIWRTRPQFNLAADKNFAEIFADNLLDDNGGCIFDGARNCKHLRPRRPDG